MVAIDLIASQVRKVREEFGLASTQAASTALVPSGTLVGRIEANNFHVDDVLVSGVPIYEDPAYPNAARIGLLVSPSSGTDSRGTEVWTSNPPLIAESGLRFYSTSTGADQVNIRVYTD